MVLVLNLVLPSPSFALDEVNLHISAGISGNALLYKFAIEKGFYREEGLDVRPIQAGMLAGIQGLVGGSFHFSQILGQGAGAILRGVPLKIVMVFEHSPAQLAVRAQRNQIAARSEGRQADRRLKLRRRSRSNDPRPAA